MAATLTQELIIRVNISPTNTRLGLTIAGKMNFEIFQIIGILQQPFLNCYQVASDLNLMEQLLIEILIEMMMTEFSLPELYQEVRLTSLASKLMTRFCPSTGTLVLV